MNKLLLVKIEALEAIHTKAVINNDSELTRYAMRELEELYAQQWGLK